MLDLIERLGLAPVRRLCMGDDEAINLYPCVVARETSGMRLIDFCYWTAQIVGQGLHFLSGEYADQGVQPRDAWVFWAPILTPGRRYGESIFAARRREGEWHYTLTFYSADEQLHERLAECVLHAAIGEGQDHRREVGRPQRGQDDGVSVTSFEVCVPVNTLHTASLLTAAQFG